MADRHRLLCQTWPGLATEVEKRVAEQLCSLVKRENMNERMNLSLRIFVFIWWWGLLHGRHVASPRGTTCWLTLESTRGSYVDPPTIWWCTLTPLPLDSLAESKSPHHTAQTSPLGQCLTRPFRALIVSFWAKFSLGPKSFLLINSPFFQLSPFSFIFLIYSTYFLLFMYI